MPVDPSGYHPIIQAVLQLAQAHRIKNQTEFENELAIRKQTELEKTNREELKNAAKRLELDRQAREWSEKAQLWNAEQIIRGQYTSGIRKPEVFQEGGPLQTVSPAAVVDTPMGQIGLSDLAYPKDVQQVELDQYKAQTPLVVDRTQQIEEVKAQADLPKFLMQLKASAAEKAADRNVRLDVAKMQADASKYRADSSFAARVRAAGISASARKTAAQTGTGVNRFLSMHDSNPLTRRYTVAQEALTFVNSLPNDTKQPSDDIGLIYAFAKAMDPESVVREGEYATVQKYSQSWLQKFGFNVNRIINNSEFLTPEARAGLKNTILSKSKATAETYKAYRKTMENRIDAIAGVPGYGNSMLGDVYTAPSQNGTTPNGTKPRRVFDPTTGTFK